jgi:hypothetical protein
MSLKDKIVNILDKSTYHPTKVVRFILIILLAVIVGVAVIAFIFPRDQQPEVVDIDENVYLYEEVVFAGEVYIKVIGINVIETEGIYTLNLQTRIEQFKADGGANHLLIKPSMFRLKLVDKNARSNMSVFVESLARATVSAIAAGAIGGDINVIEETLGLAADYIQGSIENSSSSEKAISLTNDHFDEFYPDSNLGNSQIIDLSFVLTDEFLQSSKTMVLSIDSYFKWEKNIFLVMRPNTSPYTVNFDLNGGNSDEQIESISIEPGQIKEVPNVRPTKEGYKFLYWTAEVNNKSTKIRDLYLSSSTLNNEYTLYAYYQRCIPLDEYVNVGESFDFKNETYLISISDYQFSTQITVTDRNNQIVILDAPVGKKYLELHLVIDKRLDGNEKKLDNNDDFYLENDHSEKNVSEYYGYVRNFDSIKPISDYSWIGMNIDEIGIYTITLAFEVNSNFDLDENIYFLEVDFFGGLTFNSKSILIK